MVRAAMAVSAGCAQRRAPPAAAIPSPFRPALLPWPALFGVKRAGAPEISMESTRLSIRPRAACGPTPCRVWSVAVPRVVRRRKQGVRVRIPLQSGSRARVRGRVTHTRAGAALTVLCCSVEAAAEQTRAPTPAHSASTESMRPSEQASSPEAQQQRRTVVPQPPFSMAFVSTMRAALQARESADSVGCKDGGRRRRRLRRRCI